LGGRAFEVSAAGWYRSSRSSWTEFVRLLNASPYLMSFVRCTSKIGSRERSAARAGAAPTANEIATATTAARDPRLSFIVPSCRTAGPVLPSAARDDGIAPRGPSGF
jgi:hypothetical protein